MKKYSVIARTSVRLPEPDSTTAGSETAWDDSSFARVIDVSDPDLAYIIDAIRLMRTAGFDMTDRDMLRLAAEAGRRRAAMSEDDIPLSRKRPTGAQTGRAAREPGAPVVYYARVGNRVKIGWTSNLPRRMSQLQPEELLVVEPGGPDEEDARHAQFSNLHVVGEWFRYEPPLTTLVSVLRLRSA